VAADLQHRVAQGEDLGGDVPALAGAHARQDLGEPAGQLGGLREVGVRGEAGGDPLGRLRTGGRQRGAVRGEGQDTGGPRTAQRVDPPQDIAGTARALRAPGPETAGGRPGQLGGVGAEDDLGAQLGVAGAGHVRRPVGIAVDDAGHRHDLGRGAADRLRAADAEEPAGAAAPVRDEARAVHDDHGQRHPSGGGASGVVGAESFGAGSFGVGGHHLSFRPSVCGLSRYAGVGAERETTVKVVVRRRVQARATTRAPA
jgi:hypothetical protein